MTRKAVSTKLIAVVTAVFTMAVMCGMPAVAFASGSGVTKEETVYVVTDAAGTQQDVIVSDHLVNNDKSKTIADETNLSDIENVKGEETFSQKGNDLTWDAEGNSIYYQGTTAEEVPVTMDVTYRLDGRTVSGSELQGKSGKAEITIRYENSAEYNGTTVPFVVLTGMVVTDDSFKNVKISKGKVIDDGDKLLVVGMAAPGLAQTIGVGESELGIGSSVVITGDADKFAVEDMMTVVTNAFFEDLDTGGIDLDYDDQISALDKGAKALMDGSQQLYNGLNTMNESMPDLEKGVGDLKDGADKLSGGTKELKENTSPLISKLGTAAEGIATLKEYSALELAGLKTVQTGLNGTEEKPAPAAVLNDVAEGLDEISGALSDKADALESAPAAAQGLSDYMDQVSQLVDLYEPIIRAQGYGKLVDMTPSMKAAANQLAAGLEGAPGELSDAAEEIGNASAAVKQVKTGIQTIQAALNGDGTAANPGLVAAMMGIDNGLGDLNSSFSEVAEKTGALSEGVDTIDTGAQKLAKGMEALQDNSGTLIDGVKQLDAGSLKLSNGMSKLYKEGIKKIVDMYNNDLKGTLNSVDGMLDAGKGYKSFTKLPSGMDGNVKFIYKTDMTQ